MEVANVVSYELLRSPHRRDADELSPGPAASNQLFDFHRSLSLSLDRGEERARPTPVRSTAAPGARLLVTGTSENRAAVAASLRRAGRTVITCAVDTTSVATVATDDSRCEQHLPNPDDPKFAKLLLELCSRRSIDVVIPTSADQLLPIALARHLFAQAGVRLLLARTHTLRQCADMLALARACGDELPLPRTTLLDHDLDLAALEFPLMARPRLIGARPARRIDSAADLVDYERDGSWLLQEYLPGLAYCVDVLVNTRGRVLATVPQVDLGAAGESTTRRTLRFAWLEGVSARLVRKLGLTGIGQVRFRCSREGSPVIVDVTPGFTASMPLTIQSGVDLPRLAVDDLLGGVLDELRASF